MSWPRNNRAFSTLSVGCWWFDRPGEALRYFREAISRQSDDDTLKYHLAVALHALGRDGEARQTLEKLVGRNAQFAEKEDATELFEKLELQTN